MITAAQELQEQHSILGIPPEQLSAPAHKTLKVLAASAAALQLRTCSPAAFLMALSDLKLQQSSIAARQVRIAKLSGYAAPAAPGTTPPCGTARSMALPAGRHGHSKAVAADPAENSTSAP